MRSETKTSSVWEFLRLAWDDVPSRMSGALSVPFAFLALFLKQEALRYVFGVSAILAVLVSAYRLWATERDALVRAKARLDEADGIIELRANCNAVAVAMIQFASGRRDVEKVFLESLVPRVTRTPSNSTLIDSDRSRRMIGFQTDTGRMFSNQFSDSLAALLGRLRAAGREQEELSRLSVGLARPMEIDQTERIAGLLRGIANR